MQLTPDDVVLVEARGVALRATLVWTWAVMGALVLAARLVTRRLQSGPEPGRGQNLLEVLVDGVRRQIEEVAPGHGRELLPFVGSLFVFIAAANVLTVVPGFVAPTAAPSTAAALGLCVFAAVPLWGIRARGFGGYLRQYLRPTPLMLPFNVLGEVTRTVALAVRLFGNMLSSALIGVVLLALAPFFLPVVMQAFGLLTGLVQAYVFSVLALVYIAAALGPREALPTRPGA